MGGQEQAGVLGRTGSKQAGCCGVALEASEAPSTGLQVRLPPVTEERQFEAGVCVGGHRAVLHSE